MAFIMSCSYGPRFPVRGAVDRDTSGIAKTIGPGRQPEPVIWLWIPAALQPVPTRARVAAEAATPLSVRSAIGLVVLLRDAPARRRRGEHAALDELCLAPVAQHRRPVVEVLLACETPGLDLGLGLREVLGQVLDVELGLCLDPLGHVEDALLCLALGGVLGPL